MRVRFASFFGVAWITAVCLGLLATRSSYAADVALNGNWISTGVSPVSGNISGYGYYQDLSPYGMPGLTVVLYVESTQAPVFAGNGIAFSIPAIDPGTKMTFSFLGTGGLTADATMRTTLNSFQPQGLVCFTNSGAVNGTFAFNIEGSYSCINTSAFAIPVTIAKIEVTVGPPNIASLLALLGLTLSSDGTSILGPNGEILVYGNSPMDTFTNFCATCGQPVNMVNGTLWHRLTDFVVRGRTPDTKLELTRTYLSKPVIPGGDFGPHWFHNWESRILALNAGPNPDLVWIDETGGAWIFKRQPNGTYANPPGFFGSLSESAGEYILDRTHGVSSHFSKNVMLAPYGRLLSIVERHGEKIDLSYDANGRLSKVSSPFAGSVTFSRNAAGYIDGARRVRDDLNYTYQYDSRNRLSSSADFEGHSTFYTYVANNYDRVNGLLFGLTDPLGRTTSNEYDPLDGKVVAQTEPGNARRQFYYDGTASAPFNVIFEIDGSISSFYFRSRYLLSDIYGNLGKSEHFEWSDRNQLSSRTDSLGFTTLYGYDSRGNLASIRKPLDPSPTRMTYDPVFDQPKSLVPLVGAPGSFQVNSVNGDVFELSRSAGGKTLSLSFGYDSFGNARNFSNGLATFAHLSDANGLLTLVFDQRNPETRSYDSRGRVSRRVFQSGRVLEYEWDNYDRMKSLSDSSGPSMRFAYDVVGNLLTRTISDGRHDQTTSYAWDARDRLISEMDALGNETRYEYDLRQVISKPIAKIDPNGHRTTYFYDLLGRLVTETDPVGGTITYGYNARGDRTSVTDAVGKTTSFAFDGNGRVVTRSRPSLVSDATGTREFLEVTSFFYDAAGKVLREEKSSAASGKSVKELSYDGFDRVIRRTLSRVDSGGGVKVEESATFEYANELDRNLIVKAANDVATLEFSYDSAPPYLPIGYSVRATNARNPLGLIEGSYRVFRGVSNGVESIRDEKGRSLFMARYDAAARLLAIASGNRIGGSSGALAFKLSYDGFGRKSGVDASSGEKEEIAYDDLNRIKILEWSESRPLGKLFDFFGHRFGNRSVTEALSYDPTGNITAIDREFGRFEYGYDPKNQLVSVEAGDARRPESRELGRAFSQAFRYDLAGNRTFATSDGGSAEFLNNQLIRNSEAEFESDGDGFGGLASVREKRGRTVKRFAYRADGKLDSFSVEGDCDRSDDDGFVIRKAEYFYDAFGRRVAKRLTAGDGTERRLGKREKSIVHRYTHFVDEDKILMAVSAGGNEVLYLDGPGIDEHLGQVSRQAKRVYATDHLGSVLNSSLTGKFMAYGAFGTGSESRNWFGMKMAEEPVIYGFSGRQYDSESETYYYRARTYSPDTGRFLQKDPIGFAGGDLNLYRYTKNSPIEFTDPTGKVCGMSASNSLAIGTLLIAGGYASLGYASTSVFVQPWVATLFGAAGWGGILGGGALVGATLIEWAEKNLQNIQNYLDSNFFDSGYQYNPGNSNLDYGTNEMSTSYA